MRVLIITNHNKGYYLKEWLEILKIWWNDFQRALSNRPPKFVSARGKGLKNKRLLRWES